MDEFHNVPAQIHSITRKRKADQDDCSPQDVSAANDSSIQPEPMLIDPSATPRAPANPQSHQQPQHWWLVQHAQPIVPTWEPSPSPPLSPSQLEQPFTHPLNREGPRPKRPRIEIPQPIPSHRRLRRSRPPFSASPRRVTRHLHPGDLGDRISQSLPVSPIDSLSSYIPLLQPPINRDTLKELDLEAILRNPQLRHDLLFDSGLQFRPTSSRRKRDMADSYWKAIAHELEWGCTCVTLDAHGRPRDCICSCLCRYASVDPNTLPRPLPPPPPPPPIDRPISVTSPCGTYVTFRTPSRLKPLLSELLEVLISIIQPNVTPRSTSLGVHPGLLHPQYNQNSTHVTQLRSILDADLIQQVIDHGLFDPSGVFQTIGNVIRCYCAPMRDHAVDQMVKLAQSCAPGGTGTNADAVRAIRLCFEIMELMKLDVANHQLQTLRPYLVHSAAQFELKMFQESRQKGQFSLHLTREWLRAAFSELSEQNVAGRLAQDQNLGSHPQQQQQERGRDREQEEGEGGEEDVSVLGTSSSWSSATGLSPSGRNAPKLPSRHVQIQTAVTKAIVGLIFDPPSPTSPASPSSPNSTTTSRSPSPIASPTPSQSHNASPHNHNHNHHHHHRTSAAQPGYPETLYLDHSRLMSLSTDAADFTALYMLLMLYRQLVHSGGMSGGAGATAQKSTKVEELVALKKEIWEIGPAHLGHCFVAPAPTSSTSTSTTPTASSTLSGGENQSTSGKEKDKTTEEWKKWKNEINDVVLQLTMRASQARSRTRTNTTSTSIIPPPATNSNTTTTTPTTPTMLPPVTMQAPDPALLRLATSWTESHLRSGSPLGTLMRKRIRKAVEEAAIELVVPSANHTKKSTSSTGTTTSNHPHNLSTGLGLGSSFTSGVTSGMVTNRFNNHSFSNIAKGNANTMIPGGGASGAGAAAAAATPGGAATSGLEPLMPEIHHLAERLSKLVAIHMDVYGALYAQPGFLAV